LRPEGKFGDEKDQEIFNLTNSSSYLNNEIHAKLEEGISAQN
jgi:hypothetical protein